MHLQERVKEQFGILAAIPPQRIFQNVPVGSQGSGSLRPVSVIKVSYRSYGKSGCAVACSLLGRVWSEFVIQMSAKFVSFGAGLTLRPLIVGLCSLTCNFKNKTILGLGISFLSCSRKPRSLAGSVVQWGGPTGTPCMALEGSGKGFPCFWWDLPFRSPGLYLPHTLSQSYCFPRTVGGSPCLARGARTWEVLGRRGQGGVPWWALLPGIPGSICTLSRNRLLFSWVTSCLI